MSKSNLRLQGEEIEILRVINGIAQASIRHCVALVGTTLGGRAAGRANVSLWRLKSAFHPRVSSLENQLHILHIPRTSGTATKEWLGRSVPRELQNALIFHDHGVKLRNLRKCNYALTFRQPISRFDSVTKQAGHNLRKSNKLRQMSRLGLSSQRKFTLPAEGVERLLSSGKIGPRYLGYLALNAAGELSEPMAAWLSVRQLTRCPPAVVQEYDDNERLKVQFEKFLGVPLPSRQVSNSSSKVPKPEPNYSVEQFPELYKFLRPDFLLYESLVEICQTAP